MSDEAKSLLHYATNWREACADDADREFSYHAARTWAAYLIERAQ